MKKFLGFFITFFLWCNIGIAEIYELGKCFDSYKKTVTTDGSSEEKYTSWEDFNKNGIWDDITITINPTAGTVIFSYIQNEEKFKESLKKFEKTTGKKFTGSRIKQRTYQITSYTQKFITAKVIENVGEYKIYIDIENSIIDSEIKTTFSASSREKILCEDFPSYIAQDDEDGNVSGSSGTAFFINNKGHLLTNYHVVQGCTLSKISYKNKDYDTKLIATDKTLDLALLKSDLIPKSFFTFSKNEAKKLNKVYVAGYPLGKGLSDDLKISSGIISSLKGFEDNSNEIQIDAPINPGNSGGPIINENGDLVAIAVSGLAKDLTEGINFGIKSSSAEIFLRTNKINIKKSMYSGIKDNDRLLEILEEGTVYTYCN